MKLQAAVFLRCHPDFIYSSYMMSGFKNKLQLNWKRSNYWNLTPALTSILPASGKVNPIISSLVLVSRHVQRNALRSAATDASIMQTLQRCSVFPCERLLNRSIASVCWTPRGPGLTKARVSACGIIILLLSHSWSSELEVNPTGVFSSPSIMQHFSRVRFYKPQL